MSKKLVAFFSATGSTRKAANIFAEVTGGDIYEIKPAAPYTGKDIKWSDHGSRSYVEMHDPNSRPELEETNFDISSYDTMWGVAPHIINSFLESYDFTGKTIVIFATSGGSGFGQTVNELKPSAPNAKFIECKVFRGRANKDVLEDWLKNFNI